MTETPAAATVAVLVVNYQTPDITIECLRSLIACAGEVERLAVVVVDNGSGDGSAERIAAAIDANGWTGRVTLVALDENVGFGRGVNHAFRHAPPSRYLLALNSDAELHPGVLRLCVERLDAEPRIGAFSCMVLDPDGSVQNVARRFPTPLVTCLTALGLPYRLPRLFGWADPEDPGWDRRTTARDVDWLGGVFLFLRTRLIDEIGLFDERFFFFGEDVELCHRVRRAGHLCRYDPGATVTHIGGASPDGARSVSEWRSLQMQRARYELQRVCHGRLAEGLVRGVDRLAGGLRLAWRRLRLGRDDPRTVDARRMLRLLRDA